jgi:hypothetical protein
MNQLDRRKFLLGSAAVIAAAVAPTIAGATAVESEPLPSFVTLLSAADRAILFDWRRYLGVRDTDEVHGLDEVLWGMIERQRAGGPRATVFEARQCLQLF